MKRKLTFSLSVLLTLVLTAVTVVALTGCGKKETPCITPTGGVLYDFSQTEVKRDVVKLWVDSEDYAEALKAAFEVKYPNIIVDYELIGHVDTRARLELMGADGADVLVFPHDHISLALRSNIISRVPQALENTLRDVMLEATLGTVESCYDTTTNQPVACTGSATPNLFGAPLAAESMALFYNKSMVLDIFTNYTTIEDFEENVTMDEILAKSYEYNVLGQNSQYLFAMDIGNAYDAHMFLTPFGYEIFGSNHNDKTQLNATSPEMLAALDWIQNNLAKNPETGNRVLPESGTLTGDFVKQGFYGKNIPMITSGPWSIQDALDALGDDLGIMKIPTINGVQPVTYSGVQVVAVSSFTKVPASAWTLLEFMVSEEGAAILYEENNKLPALSDLSNIPGISEDSYLQGISAQLAFSHPMPTIPEMGFVWGTFGTMLSNVFNGTRTPELAANQAKTSFDGLAGLTG